MKEKEIKSRFSTKVSSVIRKVSQYHVERNGIRFEIETKFLMFDIIIEIL